MVEVARALVDLGLVEEVARARGLEEEPLADLVD